MLMNRMGQFAIAAAMIERWPEEVLQLFKDVIVIQATLSQDGSVIQYTGVSKHFRELLLDATVPVYECVCTKAKDGTISIKWIEQTSTIIAGRN